MFPTTSRYSGIETVEYTLADGRLVRYLRRRFLPPSSKGVDTAEHVVHQKDRLDRIAATYFGDPEQFWRICDSNDAMKPEELTAQPGRRLRIKLPGV